MTPHPSPSAANTTAASASAADQHSADQPSAGNDTNAEASPSGPSSKWLVLAVVMLGTFMTTLDGSIVNIALPSIAQSFSIPLGGSIEWIQIGYLMIIAATLLTLGRLSDLLGRKAIYLLGLIVFVIGSALCFLVPSLGWLIAARAVQGLGAAGVLSLGIALLSDAFPASERGRALGYNAIVLSLGISAGPTLGGLLIETLSWRWIFLLNVPIGLIAALVAWRSLPGASDQPQQPQLDLPGAGLLAVGLASLTAVVSFGQTWGWTSWLSLDLGALGLAALVALFFTERRVKSPVLDLELLTNRAFAAPLLALALTLMALLAVGFLMPFYFEQLRGYSTLKAGLLLTAQSLAVALVSPIGGALADRLDPRWLTSSGLSLVCAGLLLLSQIGTQTSTLWIMVFLAMIGLGVGIFSSPNNKALMATAPEDEKGEASGLLATGRSVGQGLSIALAGAIFTGLGGASAGTKLLKQGDAAGAAHTALQQQFLHAFSVALLVSAGLAALGVIASLLRGQTPATPDQGSAPDAGGQPSGS